MSTGAHNDPVVSSPDRRQVAENVRTEALLKADDPPPAPAWFSGDAAYGWACGWSAGFLAALALIDGRIGDGEG